MIHPQLYTDPKPIDREAHRELRLALPFPDYRFADKINSTFISVGEFGDACMEYAVVFVNAGEEEGKPLVAPIAVLGVRPDENLYVDADGRWRASYVPALIRMYPFTSVRGPEQRAVLVLDQGCSRLGREEGEPLFDASGEPAALLTRVQQGLEPLDEEVQRTRAFGTILRDRDLLKPVRFDATLPDGKNLMLDGFATIDEDKLRALPDAVIAELERNGVLGLIHAHLLSLRHMRRLAEWHAQRLALTAGAANAPGAATPASAAGGNANLKH